MRTFYTVLFMAVFVAFGQAQVFEGTKSWFTADHSAWKIEPQSVQGYVIAGNKFFEPSNTDIYFSQFDEFGQFGWTRNHNAAGFSSLQTMWKSFVRSSSPVGFFAVLAGTQGGSNRAYAILVNSYGMKFWDRVSVIPNGVQYGGAGVATNGGYVATGSDGSGNMLVSKFNAYGEIEWTNTYPVSGFGWTIKQAVGGGYIIAGTTHVVRIDHLGNFMWSSNINLPPSPSGAYTYTEFEEILPLPTNDGFIVTGSAFSNSHSATYTARFNYNGGQVWARVHDAQNTALAGTPVAWTNNAVISGSNEIVTSWRRGPVSTGGGIYFQKMSFDGTLVGAVGSFGNTTPLQEGFMTKAHGKYIVSGVRGSYSSVIAYAREFLPVTTAETNEENLPFAPASVLGRRQQISVHNALPEFEQNPDIANPGPTNPASRVFYSDLQVFPNPSTGWVNIGGALEPGAMLRVTDMTGRVVLQQEIQEGDYLLDFDLSQQTKGLYNVEMIGQSGVTVKKVVLQ